MHRIYSLEIGFIFIELIDYSLPGFNINSMRKKRGKQLLKVRESKRGRRGVARKC